MKTDIRIDGLDRLRRSVGTASRTIDKELRPEMRAGGQLIRDEARRRAPGRMLQPSIQFRALTGGLTVIIGSIAKTALSIEVGRARGEKVSLGLLTGWLRRKGLTGAVSVKTRRSVKSRGAARAYEREAAYALAAAIRRRGTKPLPFLMPAVPATRAQVGRRIRDAVGRALHQIARGA